MTKEPKKPKELIEREGELGVEAEYHGDGYWSLTGYTSMAQVAYICLPKKHPDVGKDYYDIMDEDGGPDVNGGFTYSEGPVFGWDYAHAFNDMNIDKHVRNAIKFFKKRA